MAAELTRTLMAWALALPAAFSLGFPLARPLAIERPLFRGIVAYGIGLTGLSYAVVLLSAVGHLNAHAIWLLLLALALPTILRPQAWLAWLRAAWNALSRPANRTEWALTAIFWVSSAALLAGTLAPEIGGDALSYQLNLPKVFLAQGSLAPSLEDYNSFFPLLMNNLYLIGLATGGVGAAKLFHFFCGFLLVLGLYDATFAATGRRALALATALALWTLPTVYNTLSTTYVDVGLAFFTFLALVCFVEALERDSAAWSLASGFLAGAAVSVKYLGLASVLGLAAVGTVWALRARRASFAARHASAWTAAFALGCGYWLVRNAIATGNPFFPYWGHWFGLEHRPPTDHHLLGMGRSALAFLGLFWNMFRHPEPFGGFPVRVGIFPLLFAPFALAAAIGVPRSRPYALFSIVFLTTWFFLVQAARWLTPLMPVLFLTGAQGLAWAAGALPARLQRAARRGGSFAAVGLLCVYVAAGLYHHRYDYLLWSGRWSRQDYLRKLERTAPVATWVNTSLPQHAKILVEAEPRKFYFNRAAVSDIFLRWSTHYDQTETDAAAVAGFLQARGITHILLSDPAAGSGRSQPLTPLRRLAASPFARELQTIRSENIRDPQIVYRIYELR